MFRVLEKGWVLICSIQSAGQEIGSAGQKTGRSTQDASPSEARVEAHWMAIFVQSAGAAYFAI